MNIYFIPSGSKENKYIENLLTAFGKHDINVINRNKDDRFYSMMFWVPMWVLSKKTKIFHFNWILGITSQSITRDYVSTYSFMLWMKILQFMGCKFVWTVHNKIPHDAKNVKLALRYMSFLTKNVDSIIIHCSQTKVLLANYLNNDEIERKVVYIPHGNYISSYSVTNCDLRTDLNISKDELVFMFLGQVRPYKNVDILIKSFSELNLSNAKLLICGEALNDNYQKYILGLIGDNKKIMFISQFIPDERIVTYLNTADLLVLPYNRESILNSGAMFLAFSYKLPVIIPEICSVVDIGTDKDFMLTYSYSSENEHYTSLKQKLNECNDMFQTNPDCFKVSGREAFDYVRLYNNWDDIVNRLSSVYKQLISK